MTTSDGSDRIELSVPLEGRYARLVRLLAGAMAHQYGFSIDRVDDVKLAVEEAFLLGSELSSSHEPVTITIEGTPDGLKVAVSRLQVDEWEDAEPEDSRCGRYGLFILNAITDDARFVRADVGVDLRMTVRDRGDDG